MRAYRISFEFAAFIMLFLLIACSSTKFSTVWKDETYHERPKKILVINAFPNPSNRRLFEDELVKALKERRIDAIESYTVMPDPIVSDMNTIAIQAKGVGADTVLINTPIGTTKGETSGAGGMTYTDLYINTQTSVYEMKTNKLIMNASAETWVSQGDPYAKQIHSYVKELVNKMSKLGLF